MVHAIPFHPRNAVAIAKKPAFPYLFVVTIDRPVVTGLVSFSDFSITKILWPDQAIGIN